MKDITTPPPSDASAATTTPQMIPWVGTSVHADGFWNPKPEASEGSTLSGVLLCFVGTTEAGIKIQNPFYIFKLTKPLTRDAFVDHKPVKCLPEGSLVGVAAWKALKNITRSTGFLFELTYEGKKKLASGNSAVKLKMEVSRTKVMEIEPVGSHDAKDGDPDVEPG